jgi:hypothetical protein
MATPLPAAAVHSERAASAGAWGAGTVDGILGSSGVTVTSGTGPMGAERVASTDVSLWDVGKPFGSGARRVAGVGCSFIAP